MRKNPTPAYIATFGGIISFALTALLGWLFGVPMTTLLLMALLVAILTAGAFYALVVFFVQRKIELVYHNIYRFRAQDKKFLKLLGNPGTDPVEEMSTDVFKWMQENKKEILELREQAKFRRQFVGNVSHELKTPIFAIQGYIHTLLDGALEDREVNRNFLLKAAKGVDQLAELVEDLTEINQLQSGDVKLIKQDFDLAELCEEVFDLVQSQASERGVRLEFGKDGLRTCMVHADRRQIMQVLTNLVVNAIKYGRKNGSVEVICRQLGSKLLIDVKDDGEGIEESHLPRLFDRFYRIDKHRNREGGGTGLGLSIVKHIIESHKETISVGSQPGKGTTFTFSLPRA